MHSGSHLAGIGAAESFPSATLANGTMGHALDYDDFGGFGHPTMAITTTGRSEVANLTPEPSQVPGG